MNQFHSQPFFLDEQVTDEFSIEFQSDSSSAPNVPQIELFELDISNIEEPMVIFDFDKTVTILIDDHQIPGGIFDYLNPLIVDSVSCNSEKYTPNRPGKIFFYDGFERLNKIKCWRLVTSFDFQNLLTKTISYPSNYYLDYKRIKISRSGEFLNFWEAFNTRNLPNYRLDRLSSFLEMIDPGWQFQLEFNEDQDPENE
jgi:hypothetical protein